MSTSKITLDVNLDRLDRVSAAKRITLSDVAHRLGLTSSAVSKLARGQSTMSVQHLLGICEALDVELWQITAPEFAIEVDVRVVATVKSQS